MPKLYSVVMVLMLVFTFGYYTEKYYSKDCTDKNGIAVYTISGALCLDKESIIK